MKGMFALPAGLLLVFFAVVCPRQLPAQELDGYILHFIERWKKDTGAVKKQYVFSAYLPQRSLHHFSKDSTFLITLGHHTDPRDVWGLCFSRKLYRLAEKWKSRELRNSGISANFRPDTCCLPDRIFYTDTTTEWSYEVQVNRAVMRYLLLDTYGLNDPFESMIAIQQIIPGAKLTGAEQGVFDAFFPKIHIELARPPRITLPLSYKS